MRKSTNKLTKHELNFAKSTLYPLTKQQIVHKTNLLFNDLGKKLVQNLGEHQLINSTEYKITRGENYNAMPYVVLDFPRLLGKDFEVVCRTMFWWGHYFSCNLIIKTELIDVEQTAKNIAGKSKIKLWTGNNLWEQNLQTDEYAKLKKLTEAEIIEVLKRQPYLKMATRINLDDFETLPQKAQSVFEQWLSLVVMR
jgi:hypothetical protein